MSLDILEEGQGTLQLPAVDGLSSLQDWGVSVSCSGTFFEVEE